jgi:hypothetical protein
MADLMTAKQVIKSASHILPDWEIENSVLRIKSSGLNLLVFNRKILGRH